MTPKICPHAEASWLVQSIQAIVTADVTAPEGNEAAIKAFKLISDNGLRQKHDWPLHVPNNCVEAHLALWHEASTLESQKVMTSHYFFLQISDNNFQC